MSTVSEIIKLDKAGGEIIAEAANLRRKQGPDRSVTDILRGDTRFESVAKKIAHQFDLLEGKTISDNDQDKLFRIFDSWSSLIIQCEFQMLRLQYPEKIDVNYATEKHKAKEGLWPLQGSNYKVGTVVSISGEKTVKMQIERGKDSPVGKILPSRTNIMVHDELGQCRIGDVIVARETKKWSKRKNYLFEGFIRRPDRVRRALSASQSNREEEKQESITEAITASHPVRRAKRAVQTTLRK